MKQFWFVTATIVASCSLTAADAEARSAIDRDVSGYAIASCMIASGDAILIEQGQGWANAIVQRSRGRIETFQVIPKAVNEEIKVTGFAVGRRDGPIQLKNPKLFMLTCGEIADRPRVARAIARARQALVGFYKKPR
jgi:hypothetical protein